MGRLVAVNYGGGSAGSYSGFDVLGRVNTSVQQTDAQNYWFAYGYNLAGMMTTETYPSGCRNSGMIQYDETWFSPFAVDRQPPGNVTSVKRLISGAISGGTYATSY